MDLNQFPLFVAVAQSGSISEAARRLGVPKSTVSRNVTALEKSLGVQLLSRTTRQVRLTTAGTAFFEKARAVTRLAHEAVDSMPERSDAPSGSLRITTAVDIGLTLLPDWAARFAARFPQVRLDVQLSNENQDLVGRQFDVALRIGRRLTSSTLVARKLAPVQFELYAAPAYLMRAGSPRTLDELSAHQSVVFRMAEPMLPRLAPPRVITDDVTFAWLATRQGLGVGALPRFLAAPDVEAGRLVRVLPRWHLHAGDLFFVHPPAAHLPRKVTAFRDFLLEQLKVRPLQREV